MARLTAVAVAGMLALLAAIATARSETGIASYYYHGKSTANGERFNPDGLTAAHRTLPFGTLVRVTSLSTQRSIVVRINDRGPFVRGRIIDLARGAARQIGMIGAGVIRVRIEEFR